MAGELTDSNFVLQEYSYLEQFSLYMCIFVLAYKSGLILHVYLILYIHVCRLLKNKSIHRNTYGYGLSC